MWEAQGRIFSVCSLVVVFSAILHLPPTPNNLDVCFFCIEANRVHIGCLSSLPFKQSGHRQTAYGEQCMKFDNL